MSGIKGTSYQHPEERMKFWGITCVGGKAYKQVEKCTFHLTMAVLDPKSYDREVRDRTVTLSVIQRGQLFLLCVLKHGEIQQINLNLIFDKGDDVTFSVNGCGSVYLTGYQLIDSRMNNSGMDNEHYCPVTELGSERPMHRLGLHSILKKALKDEELDDEDEKDSDFSVSSVADEEEEEEYEESEDREMLESEIEALKQEEEDFPILPPPEYLAEGDEGTTPLKHKRSEKRKLKNMSPSEKRMKRETSREDEQSDADQGDPNSSIGNTPMPKKGNDSVKAKKKLKKRLSEISNLGSKSEKENVDSSTPKNKSPKNKPEKQKNPILKLDGGIEVRDVAVGKGPVASKGKIVSIFYMGRLENNTIFDARTAPNKPFSFKLGASEVIKGLDIGIIGMRVGGHRKLKIPAKMGYGKVAVGEIPPDSTLYFTVELLSVIN